MHLTGLPERRLRLCAADPFPRVDRRHGQIKALPIYDNDRATHGIGDLRLAHDILIKDNTIEDSGGVGIHIANASNVTIEGNTIENPNKVVHTHRFGIWVEASSGMNLKDNQVQGTSIEAPVKQDP